jgi:serine O-acetyltransferase
MSKPRTAADRLSSLAVRLHAACAALAPGEAGYPDRAGVARLCDRLLALLFPGCFASGDRTTPAHLETRILSHLAELEAQLLDLIARAAPERSHAQVHELVMAAMEQLPEVRGLVGTDVEAAFHNDPAAPDTATIVLSYPCIEALAVQRFANRLYRLGVPRIPRMMTEVVHGRTGIDIHPGAGIDESFFIDHGTGVVIGETSRIGKHCVLYQGVGLVAWNPLAKDAHGELCRGMGNKRHPDLADHVTIYAGATILGGDTVIGHHSVIGGNVWLTCSTEPYTVVTIKDPELNIRSRKR